MLTMKKKSLYLCVGGYFACVLWAKNLFICSTKQQCYANGRAS